MKIAFYSFLLYNIVIYIFPILVLAGKGEIKITRNGNTEKNTQVKTGETNEYTYFTEDNYYYLLTAKNTKDSVLEAFKPLFINNSINAKKLTCLVFDGCTTSPPYRIKGGDTIYDTPIQPKKNICFIINKITIVTNTDSQIEFKLIGNFYVVGFKQPVFYVTFDKPDTKPKSLKELISQGKLKQVRYCCVEL